jgi:UDP-GlcNAc:undecaprenyl-phosphate GlcNAc-1-phosphate transferase
MSTWLPIAFAAAFGVAAAATPLVARLALALGAVDRPNERKVSRRSGMPLLGGLGVALGFFAGIGAVLAFTEPPDGLAGSVDGWVLGALLVLAVGVVDDRIGLSAWPKLAVQLAAAALAIANGSELDHLTSPLTGEVFHFPQWLTWVATTAWIVIVTNSINLIDGLDGLAAGVSAIIAATLAVVAGQTEHVAAVVAGAALVGGLLGFLPYNFAPARIFVGDTGALFVGYTLSILALEGYQRATLLTFVVPLLAFAVPLLDTGLSILRRLRRGRSPLVADRQHIHHRLLNEYKGSHRPAVLSLYGLTGCFCLIAVSFTRILGVASIAFLAIVVLLTLRILRNLGFATVDEPSPLHVEPGKSGSGVR